MLMLMKMLVVPFTGVGISTVINNTTAAAAVDVLFRPRTSPSSISALSSISFSSSSRSFLTAVENELALLSLTCVRCVGVPPSLQATSIVVCSILLYLEVCRSFEEDQEAQELQQQQQPSGTTTPTPTLLASNFQSQQTRLHLSGVVRCWCGYSLSDPEFKECALALCKELRSAARKYVLQQRRGAPLYSIAGSNDCPTDTNSLSPSPASTPTGGEWTLTTICNSLVNWRRLYQEIRSLT